MSKLLKTVCQLSEVIEMICICIGDFVFMQKIAELRIIEGVYFEKSFPSCLCGSRVLF